MDFWDALNNQKMSREFGTKPIVFSSKTSVIAANRPNTSLYMVADKSVELSPSQATFRKFGPLVARYIIAREISFDALISIYDVNSESCIALRPTAQLGKQEVSMLRNFISRIKRPNLEMRAIGMQNGNVELVSAIEQVREISKSDLIEVDLFGNAKRHIALDLKTGMGYDLLLLDRIYKPGELANDVTSDAYKTKASKLNFV